MLAEESGISFPVFDRHLDDLEAVCLLKEIVTLGDRILELRDGRRLTKRQAEEMLHPLLAASASPLTSSEIIEKVRDTLKGFEP
jgi:phage baseplate assembly protein W